LPQPVALGVGIKVASGAFYRLIQRSRWRLKTQQDGTDGQQARYPFYGGYHENQLNPGACRQSLTT
jgi:hypothetical protein